MSERKPIVRFRSGLAGSRKMHEQDLSNYVMFEACRKTVWDLGRRAVKVAAEHGIERKRPRLYPVSSKKISLGSLEDTDFSLWFNVFMDPMSRLSKDGESVRRTLLPQSMHTAEPMIVQAWIRAMEEGGETDSGMSSISSPGDAETYRSHRGDYAESLLENLDSELPPDETGYRKHDFMIVAGHILTCIRFAEHSLGIPSPENEASSPQLDIYDVLVVPKDTESSTD
jgi:hypothetical protein